MQMIERGEYAAHVEHRNALRSSKVLTTEQQVADYDDCNYVGNITIGTPSQQFTVILDTGSATLYLPGRLGTTSYKTRTMDGDEAATVIAYIGIVPHLLSCKRPTDVQFLSSSCNMKSRFMSNSSSAFVKTNRTWKIRYSSDVTKGVLGIDTVKFGGLNEQQLAVPKTTFGLATQIEENFASDPTDGILGLSFTAIAVDHIVPPLINAINQNLLDKPLFTLWMEQLGKATGAPRGIFTYGDIDTVNCGPVIAYQRLSSAIISSRTDIPIQISAVEMGSYRKRKTYEAISDTATPLVVGPKNIIEGLAKAAGGNFSEIIDGYVIPCDAKPPTLDFTIGRNKYSIDPANYFVNAGWGPGFCCLAIYPFEFGGFGPSWLLGNPFLYQFCNIYDIGQKRIGFAPSLQK